MNFEGEKVPQNSSLFGGHCEPFTLVRFRFSTREIWYEDFPTFCKRIRNTYHTYIYICICVYYICTVSRFCFVNQYLYRFWYINLFSTKLLGETRHFPAGVDATKVHAGASC